ncbi:hypothetical protein DAPPUDRAFT_233411 [Daphnia pulex]|uniref:Uncharacterized protein n=1 Tax=Daphnia pulex TaxID=6669 RepID=E9FU00_DAPPU|nr:hypothetical protein DAPPUDRAFT_233411 [Daphnia pulex]|eukprot:EFX89455.1 hypothetical protein DAPPUDRAFT_233411 [Daphnia pulex]
MNSIDITVLAIVVGVLLLVFILCGCNNRKKIRHQATRIFPSGQSNNPAAAPAAGHGRRHRRRGGRSERASETYPAGNNANVFVISIDDAPPPEYKWEELPPPSYEDAIKIASLQQRQQDSVLLTQST